MKTTFKITAILVLLIALGAGQTVLAVEKTKKYNKSWDANQIETVDISNKFGEVKFKNEGGSQITVDVLITVEASSDSKANDLLDMIKVDFSTSGKTAKAETSMENNFKSQRKFSIDYVVNVPSDKHLMVSNKYGNVVVNQLTGNGDFKIQYGNITAVSLKGANTVLDLAYGNGNIEESGNMDADISYSNITVGESGNLKLNSKYSTVELDNAKDVQTDSKYDKFNFGQIVSLTAETKYTQMRISKLFKSLQIGSGYGGIKVENVAPDFESISITNSYGQILLGLNGASYTLDAKCDYCGISYPEDRYKGNRMKENTSIELKGKVGNAGGGTVVVKSRYGEIKLRE